MTGTPSNVLVGSASIYTAPPNTAAPTMATTGLVTPATPWTEIGYTVNGLAFSVDGKNQDIYVDEEANPILIVPDTATVTFDFECAEDTLANALLAYGRGALTSVAATTTVPGTDTLQLSNNLNQYACCFVGVNAHGLSRMAYCPIVLPTGKVTTNYQRAKKARSYPVSLQAMCPIGDISIVDATAPIT